MDAANISHLAHIILGPALLNFLSFLSMDEIYSTLKPTKKAGVLFHTDDVDFKDHIHVFFPIKYANQVCFYMRQSISIFGRVRPSILPSVHPSVGP